MPLRSSFSEHAVVSRRLCVQGIKQVVDAGFCTEREQGDGIVTHFQCV
jgi:hypothetical protein